MQTFARSIFDLQFAIATFECQGLREELTI